MADFNLYFPKLLKYEGGYVNDPNDHGGPTKYGITLADWIQYGKDLNGDGKIDANDVKLITVNEARTIAKGEFWDRCLADTIINQSIAEVIVDWCYTSGIKNVTRRVQIILDVLDDGIMGPVTIYNINKAVQGVLFNLIQSARARFYNAIVVNNPSQKKFLKGWLIRNDSFIFQA